MDDLQRLFGKLRFPHILCFANDSELINKSAYECKHSTLIRQLIQTAFKSIRLSYKEHRVDA